MSISHRTQYQVGWNDVAYAINTYPANAEESVGDYAERLADIARHYGTDYHKGCQAAVGKYLSGGVKQLSYLGGWIPPR